MVKLRTVATAAASVLGVLAVASVSQAGGSPLHASVTPAAIHAGNVDLLIKNSLFSTANGGKSVLKQDFGEVHLRIDDLAEPAVVTCGLSLAQPETLAVEEFLDGGSGYGATGLVHTFEPTTGSVEFIAEPNPKGDYMYRLKTPSTSWTFSGCTVEEIS